MVRDATTAGYLTRATSPRDRRRTVLTLTPQGQALLASSRQWQRHAFDQLTAAGPTTTDASSPPTSAASPTNSTWAKEDSPPSPAESAVCARKQQVTASVMLPPHCCAVEGGNIARRLTGWPVSGGTGHQDVISGRACRTFTTVPGRDWARRLSADPMGCRTRVSHSSRAGVSRG